MGTNYGNFMGNPANDELLQIKKNWVNDKYMALIRE